MIVEVIPESKTWSELEVFSYIAPDNFAAEIQVGSLVYIPFGKRKIRGIVEKIRSDGHDEEIELKEISKIFADFVLPKKYIEIAHWISEYYLCSLGDAISLFLPPEMKRPRQTADAQASAPNLNQIELNLKQRDIFSKLFEQLKTKNKKPALIHGVTGSGKTEVYIELAKETLKLGKQVVVLVPEIMLTTQTVERFGDVFGDQIILTHSNLSKSERYNSFYDFHTGKRQIIIGPRSALLVPSENIGLIILDEEQEDTFKQDQSPRYHAATLAEQIAHKYNALLVMGSATPRVETYYRAVNGDYTLYELPTRHNDNALPAAEVIDLKNEIRAENFSPISLSLQNAIADTLKQKRQILLFLNRRGNSTFVSCRDCGYVIICHDCSIPMVYHIGKHVDSLVCHHCGAKRATPTVCPECQSTRIKYFGAGIDKIENEIHKMFSDSRISKVDSKSITSRHDYENFYNRLKNHKIDIVIGTQMIAKGLDIPAVDLVGIVSADTGLHLPHYRATEKSFELLTQVSGRSGRTDRAGKTIIQTYWPDSVAVVAAKDHDYKKFYDFEITERQTHTYPPFTHLVRIISEETNEEKAKRSLGVVAEKLKEASLTFIGPGPCFYSKLRTKFRYHIIVKLKKYPNIEITRLARENRHLIWDAEPVNLL